ncbi:hypothetical protein FGB62_23g128 [Gracilaria domingensis]|nr:hypothetical protein FGB62_23g128 [Gracilaria domingensis]
MDVVGRPKANGVRKGIVQCVCGDLSQVIAPEKPLRDLVVSEISRECRIEVHSAAAVGEMLSHRSARKTCGAVSGRAGKQGVCGEDVWNGSQPD